MRKTLEREKQRLLKELPAFTSIVQGSILKRHHVCGKANCRCKQHVRYLHTSFQLTFVQDGKTKTITIPKDHLEGVGQGLRQYKRFRQHVRRIVEINRLLIKKNPKV